jgi:hypothetical protein
MPLGLINVDVGSVLSGAGQLAKDIRAALTGKEPIDAGKAAELALKAAEMENGLLLAQVKINEVEAANPNLFVSGWRPGAGWCAVLGLFYTFIGFPMISWASSIWKFPAPPQTDTTILMELLFALLGLGAMRSYDKAQGTAR